MAILESNRQSRAFSVSDNNELLLSNPPLTKQCMKGMSLYRPSSKLHQLCRNGDTALLESHLHDTVFQGGTINQTGGANGCAPLHEAAMAGNPDIIRVLHSELPYLDMNIRTTQGPASTPLHLAAQRGKVEAVIALVDRGALIESVDRCWRTPLDVAIEYKQLQVVHILKVHEMLGAAERENLILLEKLLKETENHESFPSKITDWHQKMLNKALLRSCQVGNRRVISLLVRYGAQNFTECINVTRQTNHISAFLFLCQAAQTGDSMAVKILLHSNEEDVAELPRYDNLMMHRIILGPLLQNGRFSLSIPIHVALQAGQIGIAGEIVQMSSSKPSSGAIDWHDLEVAHMESNWFDLPGVSHLLYIGLSSNRLRRLPERVLEFKSLQKLQIHHNSIKCLPPDLFNMPNLKVLDASFNKIAALPEMLRYPLTSSLENVNLANNRLTDLPDYFINSKILVLDVSCNRMSKVPDCVTQLHLMNTLSLDFNVGIEFIPYELGNLRNLQTLGMNGLPYLKNIPPMTRTDVSPLSFLKSRARSPQSFPHYDVAVVINDSYDICSGMVVSTVHQHSRRKHYSYLTYRDTNQFLYFHKAFSLQSTIHLIVWECEAGQPADDIFPILTHLTMYLPNSQVIIAACWMAAITPSIQAQTRERIANSKWKDLEKRGLVTVMVICVDKDALVSRSNSLQYLTEVLHRKGEVGGIHLSVPNSYVALQSMLRNHVSTLKQEGHPPMIDEQRLWELIKDSQRNDLAGRKELPILVSYLTDIAAVVCLPSNRSTDSNIYILNRQWLLEALSGLLNPNPNLSNPSGLFPINCLCDLLSCPTLQSQPGLPYAFCLFLSMLGLAITVTSSQVLVPAMLSSVNTESSSDFRTQFDVRRVYTTRQVPASFWGRLIAHLRINMEYLLPMTALDSAGEVIDGIKHLSSNLPTNELLNWNYWKSGVVVYIGGTTLLFSIEAIGPILEPEYREGLEISVCNTPIGAKAMNMATATVNSLLKNWYNELWQTVGVSVPCPDCVRDGQYTLFPFDACCALQANESPNSLYCSEHDQHYSAVNLVPDVFPANGEQGLFTSPKMVILNTDDKSTCLSPPPSETVFKGRFGTMDVAVKPFPPPVPNGERTANPFLDFWHEFTLLSYINLSESSPHLMDLMVSTVKPMALVFPLACYFSLDEVIPAKQVLLPPILRIRILYQLAHALEALHSLKIIHRNVCLGNVLVFSLSMDSNVNIRLGGLSDACVALNQGLAIGEYGTFPAPEMSKYGYQYDERVDVFAYGFTSYEILSRKKLKFRRGVRFQVVSSSADRPALNNISRIAPHLATTIEKCWNNDECKRPFFGTILKTFRNPLHTITREGDGVHEVQDFNAATVRFSRNENGTFKGDLYLCSSIYSVRDSASLIHFSLPGLTSDLLPTDLLSRCIICMCCTAQYLWISFQDKYVKIYSTETLAFEKKIEFEHYVNCMAISPDAVYLGMDNGEVQMYKMSNPNPLHSPHKTRRVSYQKSIETIQVLEDCVMCCTKRSCIRIHPETLQPEQEFPVVAETDVKHLVLCLDRENGEEFLWVSFRRLQQIVVFNALTGSALYGCNSSEVLGLPKNEVWITCMLSVLDTVWVGMNTGHVLIFNAFTPQPSLLTYCKIHTEKVDQLMLLQPSYWGVNSPSYYYGDQLDSSEDSEDIEDRPNSSSLTEDGVIVMPRSMLVLSIGRGIEQQIPKVGSDGIVVLTRSPAPSMIDESTPKIHLLLMEAPDGAGAHKLECQACRSPVPYMENYRNCDSTSQSWNLGEAVPPQDRPYLDSASIHRPLQLNIGQVSSDNERTVGHIDTPDVMNDSLANGFYVVSSHDPPPTKLLRPPSVDESPSKPKSGALSKIFKRRSQKPPQKGLEGVPQPALDNNHTNHEDSTPSTTIMSYSEEEEMVYDKNGLSDSSESEHHSTMTHGSGEASVMLGAQKGMVCNCRSSVPRPHSSSSSSSDHTDSLPINRRTPERSLTPSHHI